MPRAYYNEKDPYAAQWLRNLISAGLIAPGDVDERSIVDVQPEDLEGYTQCHFFAGIGCWSEALHLAGWPDEWPAWTGSCPCQPLSVAGPRTGHLDERHLWPAFYRLIDQRKPAIVFGEQTASKDGREWLAGVRLDLEASRYACGAANLCSAGKGAPNIRQRIYWVAYADRERRNGEPIFLRQGQSRQENAETARCGSNRSLWLADTSSAGSLSGTFARISGGEEGARPRDGEFERCGCADAAWLGNPTGEGSQGQWREYRPSGERHCGLVGYAMQTGVPEWNGPTIAVRCSDGARRVSAQPNAFPLAARVKGRMGRLRAYGNAINPKLAAEFIAASSEAIISYAKHAGGGR